MTRRVRDLERGAEQIRKMNTEVFEPRELWRDFVTGDFDPEDPPERIRHWLEDVSDVDWRNGEWPTYIVHPRWTGTRQEFDRWVAGEDDWREPDSDANPREIVEDWPA
jgi:hypothetical protein